MILLSVANSALGLANASAFLLLAVGPSLASYIVCASVHSVTSWLYSWIAPAAVGYRVEEIGVARTLQTIPLFAGVSAIILFVGGPIAILFCCLLLVDCFFSPSFLLTFFSRADRYIYLELARNVANGCCLVLNLVLFGGQPELHAAAGVVIAAGIGVFLLRSNWLTPVSLRVMNARKGAAALRRALRLSQVRLLLSARGLEVIILIALNSMGQLPAMLCLKLGLALNSSLVLNSRKYGLPILLPIQVLTYCVVVVIAIWLGRSDFPFVPETLSIVEVGPAAVVAPVVTLIFVLLVLGLRAGRGTSVVFVSPGSRAEGETK